MTPNEIVHAVSDLERFAVARLPAEPFIFVVCAAHRDYWRVSIHKNGPSREFMGGDPAECFDAARAWLESYAPDEDRLAAILGCNLVTL